MLCIALKRIWTKDRALGLLHRCTSRWPYYRKTPSGETGDAAQCPFGSPKRPVGSLNQRGTATPHLRDVHAVSFQALISWCAVHFGPAPARRPPVLETVRTRRRRSADG